MPETAPATPPLSPRRLVAPAAGGDTEAQSELARWAFGLGKQGVVSQLESLAMAEAYSRLAAAKGQPTELCLLAGILINRAQFAETIGDLETADEYMVEGVYQASRAGDAGSEEAAALLLTLADNLPAHVVAQAAQFQPEEEH